MLERRVKGLARSCQRRLLRHDQKLARRVDRGPVVDHGGELAETGCMPLEEGEQLILRHGKHAAFARVEATLGKIALGVRPMAGDGIARHEDDLSLGQQPVNQADALRCYRAIARALLADDARRATLCGSRARARVKWARYHSSGRSRCAEKYSISSGTTTISGCWASARCSQEVPHFGAPMMRKSGRGRWLSRAESRSMPARSRHARGDAIATAARARRAAAARGASSALWRTRRTDFIKRPSGLRRPAADFAIYLSRHIPGRDRL